MNISEIQDLKVELQSRISKLIREFEDETECYVVHVDIERWKTVGGPEYGVFDNTILDVRL